MAPTPGIMPRNSARPGETSAYTYPVAGGAATGGGPANGGGAANGGGGGALKPEGSAARAAGAGACSSQYTVPKASRRHCSHTGLPQLRQYAVAGTSG